MLAAKRFLVVQRARYVQWMQKCLNQMNVQVHRAVSDLTGLTGMYAHIQIRRGPRGGLSPIRATSQQRQQHRCPRWLKILPKCVPRRAGGASTCHKGTSRCPCRSDRTAADRERQYALRAESFEPTVKFGTLVLEGRGEREHRMRMESAANLTLHGTSELQACSSGPIRSGRPAPQFPQETRFEDSDPPITRAGHPEALSQMRNLGQ